MQKQAAFEKIAQVRAKLMLRGAYEAGVRDGMAKVASFGAGSGQGYGGPGGDMKLDPSKFKINVPRFEFGNVAKGKKSKILALLAVLAAGSYGASKLLDGKEQAPPQTLLDKGLSFAKDRPLVTGVAAGVGAAGLYGLVKATQGGSAMAGAGTAVS